MYGPDPGYMPFARRMPYYPDPYYSGGDGMDYGHPAFRVQASVPRSSTDSWTWGQIAEAFPRFAWPPAENRLNAIPATTPVGWSAPPTAKAPQRPDWYGQDLSAFGISSSGMDAARRGYDRWAKKRDA